MSYNQPIIQSVNQTWEHFLIFFSLLSTFMLECIYFSSSFILCAIYICVRWKIALLTFSCLHIISLSFRFIDKYTKPSIHYKLYIFTSVSFILVTTHVHCIVNVILIVQFMTTNTFTSEMKETGECLCLCITFIWRI